MRLSQLLEGCGARLVRGSGAVEVTGLALDSRVCRSGYLFAALEGRSTHGGRFVGDALAGGAAAVLAQDECIGTSLDRLRSRDAAIVAAPDARHSFALLCSRFWSARPVTAIAVTGTNGKSSVAEFCRQFWHALGHPAAALGTLGLVCDHDGSHARHRPLRHTTPDPVTLHRLLAELARRDVDRVVLEASSHGLDQRRLDGIAFRAAGFTNLSHDHFDYHRSIEDYAEAKARLFDLVEPGGTAVLNADAEHSAALARRSRERGLDVVTYGRRGGDWRIVESRPTPEGGLDLTVEVDGLRRDVELPLPGHFQAMNVLCAAAMIASVESVEPSRVLALAATLGGVRGRLQSVPGHPAGARIHVDYAHTPDALRHALSALRPMARERLVVVFGCGGDRDRAKRPLMARTAGRLADIVYVTDDNPRTEDAADIRGEVLAGWPRAIEIADRRRAIRAAVAALTAGDVLLIAGKGHETGQIVGREVLPFDDVAEVGGAIAALESPG